MKAHDAKSTAEVTFAWLGPFGRRRGLPGQDRLVAFQLVDVQEADVGGNQVADPQFDHVAGYQVAHIESLLGPVAPHDGLVPDLGVQGGDRQFRPVLVDEAQTDAEDHDGGDDPRVGGVTGDP
jgi:hypothetical protein